MLRDKGMRFVKGIGLAILIGLFLLLMLFLKLSISQEPLAEEERNKGCDYFEGEIVEVTKDFLVIKPCKDWKWGKTTKVKLPITQLRDDKERETIRLQLFDGDISSLKNGDKLRVAFNAKTIEWSGEEAVVKVVFMLYRM